MSWFKGRQLPNAAPLAVQPALKAALHPAAEVQEKIAQFLVNHARVELRNGHPLMHFLGMSRNQHDGSVDYAVRSHVRGIDGKSHRFDSHVRIYATGHLRLVR